MAISHGTMIIRPAVTGDAAALHELRLEALASYPQAFGGDYETESKRTADNWVERVESFDRDGHGTILLAVARDHLVGMLGLVRGSSSKTRHMGTIWGVYLQPDWRGAGVADAMFARAFEWARQHNLSGVKLGVITTNIPAVRCYLRCGFTIYGVDPKVIQYDGIFYDEFLMVRHIF